VLDGEGQAGARLALALPAVDHLEHPGVRRRARLAEPEPGLVVLARHMGVDVVAREGPEGDHAVGERGLVGHPPTLARRRLVVS